MTKAEKNTAFTRSEVQRRLESIGRFVHEFAKAVENGARIANGVMDVARDDQADGMELGFEGGCDSEVGSGPA